MSNQYFRFVIGTGNGTSEERLYCLKELFESIYDKGFLSEAEINEIYTSLYSILKNHKEAIETLE